MITKTLKVRIKDNRAHFLSQCSKEVNMAWNFCNELSYRCLQRENRFLSGYDLQKYTKGASKLLMIDSTAIQNVCEEYATRRKQFKKAKLKWRASYGSRRSLGWVPFKAGASKWVNGQIKYAGQYFKVWDSYGLSQYQFKSGSFTEDARGRWYFNVVVEVEAKYSTGTGAVGVDLGCKEAATDSNGNGVIGREYRKLEQELGIAQRAGNKKQVKSIHAKIKNRRADALHKYSRKLVDENAAIFVGNVSSLGLVKTKMAKSVLDSGWGMLKTLLEYKCDHANSVFGMVNEAYTTQTCSCCGEIPASSPKGRAGLGIRVWSCSICGATHNRDVNAGKNILAIGLGRLAGEKVAA